MQDAEIHFLTEVTRRNQVVELPRTTMLSGKYILFQMVLVPKLKPLSVDLNLIDD